jgi:hypothetical protein
MSLYNTEKEINVWQTKILLYRRYKYKDDTQNLKGTVIPIFYPNFQFFSKNGVQRQGEMAEIYLLTPQGNFLHFSPKALDSSPSYFRPLGRPTTQGHPRPSATTTPD